MHTFSNGETVSIDITMSDDIPTEPHDKADSSAFCVCYIPEDLKKTLNCIAYFDRELVSLGADHVRYVSDFSNNESKLGIANRILKINEINEDVESDFPSSPEWYSCSPKIATPNNLACKLTVDGLFLLAVLHYANNEARPSFAYSFTGKTKVIVTPSSSERLTMDGITRDVFKITNQIPTLALQHIIKFNFNNNLPVPIHLDSLMLNFCKAHSPLVLSENIKEVPESNHHLLDLLYHLIVPRSEPNDESKPKPNAFLGYCTLGVTYLFLFLWIIQWALAYVSVRTLQPFLQLLLSVIIKVIPFAAGVMDQQMKIPTPPHFLNSVLDLFLYNTFSTKFTFTSPLCYLPESYLQKVVDAVETTRGLLKLRDATNSSESTVPTVTQLREAEIRFKGVEGNIYSIQFDEMKRELCLPRLKLVGTSEVILKNLELYESIIKNDDLKFSHYIEFMNDLIQSPKDAKILVDQKIIQTKLSDEQVAEIFKSPIGKLARSPTTKIQKLEHQLAKAKFKFDAIQKVNSIFSAFLRVCVVCAIVVVFSPLLAKAFQELGCSTIFANTFEGCKRHQFGDYATNDSYLSSV